ncbi:MAG TPA: ABC transporter permease [Clostridiaceae bacterium]|nr:ABC transporter permease [Clostridiaceae bacterium]
MTNKIGVNSNSFSKNILRQIARSASFNIFIILFVMCAIMYIISPPFRSIDNILSVTRAFSYIAIMAIGECIVIITAGVDLSVGSTFGLAGVITALCMSIYNIPVLPSILVGLVVGALIGLLNGILIIKPKLPPFIATLGTLSMARGLAYIITQGYPITKVPIEFLYLGQGYLLSIPVPVWCMFLLAVIFSVFLNKTVLGRRIYALGGNEVATRISGINTDRIKLIVYTLCGVLAAFSGIITASKLGLGQPTAGNGYELDAVAAVIIGGASLSGGQGTILGTILGAAIMGVLRNALVLLSVNAYWQQFIIGFVILFAVTADQLRKNRK